MDDPILKAGSAPSGVQRQLDDLWKEPAAPTRTRTEVVTQAREILAPRGLGSARLEVSDLPVRRGELMNAAGVVVEFPAGDAFDRCFLVLADPEPQAKWSHRAYWVFVPAMGSSPAELRETTLPEHPEGSVQLVTSSNR